MLLLFLTGCIFWSKPPPQAPENLEDLCKYIFKHLDDEEEEELQAGLTNLHTWLNTGDNLDSTVAGYQVHNLADTDIANLDERQRTIGDNLIGAAVGYRHVYSPSELSRAMFVADWPSVVGGTYDEYDRQFSQDPSCIVNRDCLWLDYLTESTSTWVGLVTVISRNIGEIRWIETDLGWMLIQRTWLIEPADISWDGIDLNSNYFVQVTMPNGTSGAIRTSATWIDTDYGALPVDEDWAKNQVIDQMQQQDISIENWLNEN